MNFKGKLILTPRFDYSIFKIEKHLPKNVSQEEVVLIPSAAYAQGEGNYNWVYPQDIHPFKQIKSDYTLLDITNHTNKEELKEMFKKVKVLIITGGDTFYLLRFIKQSGLDDIIKQKLREEEDFVLFSGCSSMIFSDDIEFSTPFDSPKKGELESFEGLNIIPFRFLPHLNHPHLAGVAHYILENNTSQNWIVGVLDEQCIVISDNVYEVI